MSCVTAELVELTGLFCDGDISPECAARLETVIAESVEARQYVLDSYQVHCELAWEFGRADHASSPSAPRRSLLISETPASCAAKWRRSKSIAMTAAALAIALGTTIALFYRHRENRSLPSTASVKSEPAPVPVATDKSGNDKSGNDKRIETVPSSVAQIVRANRVQWRDNSTAAAGTSLPAGRRMAIREGFLQIRFDSGATIILQAPAEIELQSANSAELREGSLTANVPVGGQGFAIQTSNAKVVDLGTRFGVACQAGQTDVEVFSGNVLVRPQGDHAEGREEVRLAAQHAVRVSGTPGTGPLRMASIATGSRDYVQSIAPACACPSVPQAADELIGPWHTLQGTLAPIDLSRQANRSRTDTTNDREGNNLVDLPRGPQLLAGVKFQFEPGFIHLHSSGTPELPRAVEGIPVGRRLARLFILQGAQFSRAVHGVHDGDRIAEYHVRYTDGTRATIPVVIGRDVRDWWADGSGQVSRGQIAWVGTNAAVQRSKTWLRLYLSTWENPHPEKMVGSIDFISLTPSSGPFCVAITAEEPVPMGDAPIAGQTSDPVR